MKIYQQGQKSKVAFLLTNPVSDLVNPDCFNFRFSRNENLKIDYATTPRGLVTISFSKQTWRA